jgi:hypothetical protein
MASKSPIKWTSLGPALWRGTNGPEYRYHIQKREGAFLLMLGGIGSEEQIAKASTLLGAKDYALIHAVKRGMSI